MTSPELLCGMWGRSVGGRWCRSPITAQCGVRVAHEVTDEAFAAGRGEYEALCRVVFVPAPLVAPLRRLVAVGQRHQPSIGKDITR
jgi:hypothetical protein